MADLTLRLRVDPKTGRREIVIDYSSDSDALPFEHEEEHRQLAEKVVNGGLKNNPKVEVSRQEEAEAAATPGAAEEQPTATPEATKT